MIRRNDANFTTHAEVGEWYNAKFSEMGGSWHTPPEEINAHLDAMGYPADARGTSLLDIGSGDGQLLAVAHQRGGHCYGVDASAVGREMTAHRFEEEFGVIMERVLGDWADRDGPGQRVVVVGDRMEAMRWLSGCFYFAISMGSMEHALDIPKAVAEMARVLKTGGRFLLYVPTLDYPHVDQPLETIADPEEWAELCRANGLTVEKIEVLNDNARVIGGK